MSIPDGDARLIYELTKATGGTVPGWIREAALEKLVTSKLERRRKGRRPVKGLDAVKPVVVGNVPGGGES